MSGVLPPGHMLKGEIEASEELKVSRSAYRESVRILTAKGLVQSRTKLGTWVNARDKWALLDPEVLAWAFAGEPDPSLVRDLFELRGVVEPAAAALAAARRSGADLALMGHALEEMARHTLATTEGQLADQAFHRLILDAANNEPLKCLASSITAVVSWTTQYKTRKRMLRDSIPEHRALFDAIAAGDPDRAHKAMTVLVQHAQEDTSIALTSPTVNEAIGGGAGARGKPAKP